MALSNLCIVEDEVDLSLALTQFLKADFNVATFQEPYAAIEQFDKGYSPDILLTDIKMPKMDGLTFVDKIRDKFPDLPVVVMSGYAEKSHAIQAIDLRVVRFIEKPIRTNILRDLLVDIENRIFAFRAKQRIHTLLENMKGTMQDLIVRYRDRFQNAENVIYEAGIKDLKNYEEIRERILNIKSERELENSLEADNIEIKRHLETLNYKA